MQWLLAIFSQHIPEKEMIQAGVNTFFDPRRMITEEEIDPLLEQYRKHLEANPHLIPGIDAESSAEIALQGDGSPGAEQLCFAYEVAREEKWRTTENQELVRQAIERRIEHLRKSLNDYVSKTEGKIKKGGGSIEHLHIHIITIVKSLLQEVTEWREENPANDNLGDVHIPDVIQALESQIHWDEETRQRMRILSSQQYRDEFCAEGEPDCSQVAVVIDIENMGELVHKNEALSGMLAQSFAILHRTAKESSERLKEAFFSSNYSGIDFFVVEPNNNE